MRSSRWPEPFLEGFFLRPSAARPMRAFSSFRFFILLWGGAAAGGWLPPASSSSSAAAAASAPRLSSLRPGGGYRRSAGPRLLLPRRPRGGSPGPAAAARPARAMAARAAPLPPASKPRCHWPPRDRPARAGPRVRVPPPAGGTGREGGAGVPGVSARLVLPAAAALRPLRPPGLVGVLLAEIVVAGKRCCPAAACPLPATKPCQRCHSSRPWADARHHQPGAVRGSPPLAAERCCPGRRWDATHSAGKREGHREGERELSARNAGWEWVEMRVETS